MSPVEGSRITKALFFLDAHQTMRYHYEKPSIYLAMYGRTYICNHPVYDRCTLYKLHDKGLAVIQQRYQRKRTYWTEIDEWLIDDIYLHQGFQEYFEKHSGLPNNDIYPTVTVRQVMWALKMKPILKERWETVFDRTDI